ncbi:low molecular weight protein-tyrosine-phosphatase [Carboxylicivirga sp. M1479]|uniref:low molecular weight protein-tyrosine-phosphatase n=1 Tax=Carboxylicivirga sp. M1479 TaxID=2594476 RepID=UPI001178C00A|nr:low molecular weight protein-tyrosine-phosphatase [Carboxylicivirga sp. M1479]TRX71475.1 low molecular weight phosphotyrosine protein phosphatase [Carboxylicivirga sp. M1479]
MDKTKILFVCLGNICRSPSAEAVMKSLLKERDLEQYYEVESAGITGYHAGEPADERMQRHAIQRNIRLTSISQQIKSPDDFNYYDYVIGMDDQNMNDLFELSPNEATSHKISKMTDYCSHHQHTSVPDPYYGGAEGFELVLDILEDACEGLLNSIDKND